MKIVIQFFSVIVVLFYNPFMTLAGEMTSERLLHLHQSNIAEIRKLFVEYCVTSEDKTATFVWAFSPTCEFLQWVPSENNIEQQRQISYFTDSDKVVFSTMATPVELDSFAPLSVKESLDSGINFSQTSNDFDLNLFTPRSFFLFTSTDILSSGTGKSISIQELIATSSWSSIPQFSLNERNERIWTIYIADSALDSISPNEIFSNKKSFIRIDFNETNHYLIERMLIFIPAHASPMIRQDTQEKLPLVFETWVSDYYEVTNNISFPKHVYSGRGTPWARKHCLPKKSRTFYNKDYSVRTLNINEDSVFKCFQIPEYAKVFRNDLILDTMSENNEFTPVSFWGKDNLPQMTFLNQNEYDDYVDKEYYAFTLPNKQKGFPFWKIILMCIGVSFIIFSIIFKNIRKNHNQNNRGGLL